MWNAFVTRCKRIFYLKRMVTILRWATFCCILASILGHSARSSPRPYRAIQIQPGFVRLFSNWFFRIMYLLAWTYLSYDFYTCGLMPELGHNFEHGQALSILNCPSCYRPTQQKKIENRSVCEHNPYLGFHGAKYLPRSDRNVWNGRSDSNVFLRARGVIFWKWLVGR